MTAWNKPVYRRWPTLILIMFMHEGLTENIKHTCSVRTDGMCARCDGVPQCFDLSDEMGCTNSTINLAPVKYATRSCSGNGCVDRFPRPPPLPPFSLCKHAVKTTTETATTVTTTPSTTIPEVTTQSTSGEITTYSTTPTTESTPLTITSPTTPPMTRSSTTTGSTTLSHAQSTHTPVLSTTQWLPTTTSKPAGHAFMKVMFASNEQAVLKNNGSCMTINYRIEDVIRCVDRYYWCLKNKTCLLPLKITYPTHNQRALQDSTLNNSHIVKPMPNTTPSQSTKRPVPKMELFNYQLFPTRKPYFRNQRKFAPRPSPYQQLKQTTRTKTPLPTPPVSPPMSHVFSVSQQRQFNRNQAISNRQLPWQTTRRPVTMRPWFRTTMPSYTAMELVPTHNPLGSLNNVDYSQYRTTNSDLLYALMVLQHF